MALGNPFSRNDDEITAYKEFGILLYNRFMHSLCSLDTCKFRYAWVTLIPMIKTLNNKRYSEEGKTNKGIITNVKIFMHKILKSIFPLNPVKVIIY